jgi:hypothetical protein
VYIGDENAAAHADRRSPDMHGHRIVLLAELAADKAHRTLHRGYRHLTGTGSGVVDELVDHHVGLGADADRRPVEEQDLRLSLGVRDDALVVADFLTDHKLAYRSVRRGTVSICVDRGVDADLLLRRSGERADRDGV